VSSYLAKINHLSSISGQNTVLVYDVNQLCPM